MFSSFFFVLLENKKLISRRISRDYDYEFMIMEKRSHSAKLFRWSQCVYKERMVVKVDVLDEEVGTEQKNLRSEL